MTFEAHDELFWDVIAADAVIEPLVPGLGITEGTVWHPRDNYLVFSDLSSSILFKWTEQSGASVLRKPSNITNGNFIDRSGCIISCEHASSCISRIDAGGRYIRVLASHYQGKEFNSPNDIICDSRGRIWFTDPLYGRTSARVGVAREPQLGFQGVFRLEIDGTVTLIADDFAQPNGLCLTPQENALLVNDTSRDHIRYFEVQDDGQVTGGNLFANISGSGPGKPDGMKVDMAGRVYCTGPGGIHVLTSSGSLIGVITMPANTRNFCFGGAHYRTLFLAVDEVICRVPLKVQGVAPPML
ncbi:MAG: SMP-30/gluconolactonase/LRE family protein [Betaproteobacteria bacterium]